MTNVRRVLCHGRRYSIKMQNAPLANVFFVSEHEITSLHSSDRLSPFSLFFFFLLPVQTPSFRVSRDGIARPGQTEPIRLSRLGLDKLIGIKADKRGGAAPSDTLELCRCIRPKNGLGRRLERIGATSREWTQCTRLSR